MAAQQGFGSSQRQRLGPPDQAMAGGQRGQLRRVGQIGRGLGKGRDMHGAERGQMPQQVAGTDLVPAIGRERHPVG